MNIINKFVRTMRREANYLFFREYRFGRVVRRHLRKHYSADAPLPDGRRGLVLQMANGFCHHGGLCDRLRTATYTYRYCRSHGLPFGICCRTPFRFEDYLEPVGYDWRVDDREITYNRDSVAILYTDTSGDRGEREMRFRRRVYDRFFRRHHDAPQYHLYSSFTEHGEEFGETFRELFRPNARMRALIEAEKSRIGAPYISVATRFLELLGDFREPKPKLRLEEKEARELIDRCIAAIEHIHSQNPNRLILVTSDSGRFVREAARRLPYVVTIEGEIAHVDTKNDDGKADHTKTFLDFFMIAGAERVFQLRFGPMYGGYFSHSAAMAGGKPFTLVTE